MHRMIRLIIGTAILALALSGCSSAKPAAASGTRFTAQIYAKYPELKRHPMTKTTVKRVVDGDTFQIASGEKVRLIGVNTPETVKPNSPVEHYGKEASDYTKKQLSQQTVYLVKDVSDKDKYGRLLRYVFVEGEPTMYNETLVSEGYANVMTIPPDVMFAKTFVKLAKQAREAAKGLWKR